MVVAVALQLEGRHITAMKSLFQELGDYASYLLLIIRCVRDF